MNKKTWLNLSEAAEMLGVHFTTLRRWADAGDIECIRTPGGRRRFSKESVEHFLRLHHSHHPLNALDATTDKFIDETRRSLKMPGPQNNNWMVQFSAHQRQYFQQTGNRIAALLMQYSNRDDNGEAFIDEGKQIASQYGVACYQAGFQVEQAVEVFLFFQRSFLTAVYETGLLGEIDREQSLKLYQRATHFFDEMLVTLVKQYFTLSNTIQGNSIIT